MHLTVISYCSVLDVGFEHVALVVDARRDLGRRAFARCQRPSQLLNAVAPFGRTIRTLDLHGHGAPGRMTLGDDLLVDTRPATWKVMAELDPFLAPDASIRLLACLTAAGEPGFRLLHGLSKALRGRAVFGSIADLSHHDFGPSGFRRDVAARWLVSSRSLRSPVAERRRTGPADYDFGWTGAPRHQPVIGS